MTFLPTSSTVDITTHTNINEAEIVDDDDDEVNIFDLQFEKMNKKKRQNIPSKPKIPLKAGDFIAYYGAGGMGLVSKIITFTILSFYIFVDVSKNI
jgi:hypothetical protein